jgi:hypothetical protein
MTHRNRPDHGKWARSSLSAPSTHAGTHTSAELAELFSVARSTVYRAIERARTAAPSES